MNPDPLTTLTASVKKLRAEVDRWKNIAGIMHEYLQEGDPKGAKEHYEENVRVW